MPLEKDSPESIASEWRANEEFREDVIYQLAKSVSITGTFDDVADWMKILPAALTADEAAILYWEILEQSHRLERDWRDAFVSAFPGAASLLPPPLDGEILVATAEQMIIAGYQEEFEEVVRQIAALPEGRAALKELLALAEANERAEMADTLRRA